MRTNPLAEDRAVHRWVHSVRNKMLGIAWGVVSS